MGVAGGGRTRRREKVEGGGLYVLSTYWMLGDANRHCPFKLNLDEEIEAEREVACLESHSWYTEGLELEFPFI